jgi:PBP1b-binding outer membrane lipoprotein LpoB
MIKKFNEFINEKLEIKNLDKRTLKKILENLEYRLEEYKSYILDNIEIKGGVPEYKKFHTLEKNVIMRELKNEFSENLLMELGTDKLIESIDKMMKDKHRKIKIQIEREFNRHLGKIKKLKNAW